MKAYSLYGLTVFLLLLFAFTYSSAGWGFSNSPQNKAMGFSSESIYLSSPAFEEQFLITESSEYLNIHPNHKRPWNNLISGEIRQASKTEVKGFQNKEFGLDIPQTISMTAKTIDSGNQVLGEDEIDECSQEFSDSQYILSQLDEFYFFDDLVVTSGTSFEVEEINAYFVVNKGAVPTSANFIWASGNTISPATIFNPGGTVDEVNSGFALLGNSGDWDVYVLVVVFEEDDQPLFTEGNWWFGYTAETNGMNIAPLTANVNQYGGELHLLANDTFYAGGISYDGLPKRDLAIDFFGNCDDEYTNPCFTFTDDDLDGDWDNPNNWDLGSVPGVDDCVIIPDGMMVYAPVGDLIIEEGGQVTIGSGSTLVVDGDIKNNSGDADAFVLEDGANLLQPQGAVNTGDITALKTFTFSAERKQYNFVISPLVGQSIKNIYLGAEYVIEYHEDDNLFYNAGNGDYNEFNPAKGFAIKEAAGGDASQSGTFIGVPYNGNADFTIARSQPGANYGFNLVGNPYPSAINIEQFWDSNSGSIETTFWFWDNRNNIEYEQQGAGYDGSNYATYNADAGEGNPAPTNIGDLDPREPNQYVNVGTAFMLQAKDDKDGAVVTFDNTMRTHNNGEGYLGKGSTADKDVYRLHFTTPSGIQVATTVVYFEGGDDGFASDDSRAFDSSDNIYTVLADDIELVIQGKSAFHVEDVVPLGVKAYTDGIYTISILNQKGIFEAGQNIYLRDKQLDIIHNLSEGDYEFMLPAGVNNDRFEVVYEGDGSMGIDDLLANQIIITKDKDEILIASRADNLQEVQLYDLQGRMVYNNLKVQGKELRIPSKSLGTQVLVAVVKTVKGETLTKKIINR